MNTDNVLQRKLGKLTLQAFGQGNGMIGLPGDFSPPSRFVRAAIFSANATPSETATQGIEQVFHILNNFDIPVRVARSKEGGVFHSDYTQTTMARDLQDLRYYYKSYGDQTIRMIDMKALDLNAKDVKLLGTVTSQPIVNMTTQMK